MRTLAASLLLAAALPLAHAADKVEPGLFDQLSEEEKWRFVPNKERGDLLVDRVTELQLERQRAKEIADAANQVRPGGGSVFTPATPDSTTGAKPPDDQQTIDTLMAYAQGEERRIQGLVATRKWDEAVRGADQAIKNIEPRADRAEVRTVLASIRGYREQAADAKLRDEAQASFDALGLKVRGILWSEGDAKNRLVIIDGEPRALAVNDRVKDCVVINIESDRVDFRYHFKRQRFEFPAYVDKNR